MTTAMVMVVVVVVLVPVKTRKKKKRKKKTAYIGGGQLSSLLPRTPIGGGKATLKDCGDVVLAGTRRVFAHVSRKEYFSTPHLYLT